jgi:hypothetical protein
VDDRGPELTVGDRELLAVVSGHRLSRGGQRRGDLFARFGISREGGEELADALLGGIQGVVGAGGVSCQQGGFGIEERRADVLPRHRGSIA